MVPDSLISCTFSTISMLWEIEKQMVRDIKIFNCFKIGYAMKEARFQCIYMHLSRISDAYNVLGVTYRLIHLLDAKPDSHAWLVR